MSSLYEDRACCPGCRSWATDTSVPGFICCLTCELVSARSRRTKVSYDEQYVANYCSDSALTEKISQLRARVVESVVLLQETIPAGRELIAGYEKPRLLDVGYGNGSFIRQMARRGWDAYGCDVNPTPYPGVRPVELPCRPLPGDQRYKVITFFDALEHFEELDRVRYVADNTDWIILSFPNPPAGFPANSAAWKHYRPGEHHHYFGVNSLERLFTYEKHAAKAVYVGSPEDCLRGTQVDGSPHILTVALQIVKNRDN